MSSAHFAIRLACRALVILIESFNDFTRFGNGLDVICFKLFPAAAAGFSQTVGQARLQIGWPGNMHTVVTDLAKASVRTIESPRQTQS